MLLHFTCRKTILQQPKGEKKRYQQWESYAAPLNFSDKPKDIMISSKISTEQRVLYHHCIFGLPFSEPVHRFLVLFSKALKGTHINITIRFQSCSYSRKRKLTSYTKTGGSPVDNLCHSNRSL